MKLFIVRHGQTQQNVRKEVMGPNGVLSDNGKQQAAVLAERFASIKVEKIFCSTYERAKQTAGIVNEKLGVPIEYTPLLVERKTPTSLLGHSIESEELKKYNELTKTNRNDPDWHFEDAENMHDTFNRAVTFLEFAKSAPHESALAVTHGTFLRYTLAAVLLRGAIDRLIQEGMFKTAIHANTGITVLQLGPTGEWELVTWNDHAHLGDTHEPVERPKMPI